MFFEIVAAEGAARAGIIHTPHGDIMTPTFTVVGTYGTVKFIPPEMLRQIGAQAMLSNGYHLYRRADEIAERGGLAAYSGWDGPTLSDSGGFQVMSLGSGIGKVISMDRVDIAREARNSDPGQRLAKVTDDGVEFTNPIDGKLEVFTPETSMETQFQIGADIIMAFDELTSIGDSYEYNKAAVERTELWAQRCLEHINALHSAHPERPAQALYGVLQGAHYRDLRERTARNLAAMDFAGYGLGGAFEKEQLGDILNWTNAILPNERPRHLLGLSRPDDIFVGVTAGIDTFDCVAPTREARHGRVYTPTGYANLMRSRFANNPEPIDPDCDCPTCCAPDGSCKSTGTLRALLKSHDDEERRIGYALTSVHNVRFIIRLMEQIRSSIIEGQFPQFKSNWLERFYG